MALGPATLGGATGARTVWRQFSEVLRLRSLPSVGPSAALTSSRGSGASRLETSITPGRLDIDYTATRESMGYYQPLALLREIITYTDKARARGIAQIVADGNHYARPDRDPHAIANVARETMFAELRTHKYGIAFIPKTPPQITYIPGATSIDVVF